MITSKTFRSIYPFWMLVKRVFRGKSIKPRILNHSPQPSESKNTITFVMIVSPEFDQRVPNASQTARLGWCHGFEKIGIPYRIISILELHRFLPMLHHPICWITESDYRFLTRKNLEILKNVPHIVWVNPWFHGEEKYYRDNGTPYLSGLKWVRQSVLESVPSIVFTISPPSSFVFYEQWIKQGVKFCSLPLAWDEITYPKNPIYDPKFENVIIAFVGGYWNYKARQLDRYLYRYASNLTVFGYSK